MTTTRTLRGLLLTMYGWAMWYLTLGVGCRWFTHDLWGLTIVGRIGRWLVIQYGWARNREWQ